MRSIRSQATLLIALAAWLPQLRVASAQGHRCDDTAVREQVARAWHDVRHPVRSIERRALERLYASPACPLWTTSGRVSVRARELMAQMARVGERGLDERDFVVDTAVPVDIVAFDVAMSRSLVTLTAQLHMGRIDARELSFDIPHTHDTLDLAALVLRLRSTSDVAAALDALEPHYASFRALKSTLARYRALAADTTAVPWEGQRTIKPGNVATTLPALQRLLVALGDLPAITPLARDAMERELYGGALVDAVKHFQRRHGLDPDGAIGAATRAQLRVPMAARVRQIELTLERWRWLPDRPPERYVVVNVPAFRLYAFEHDSEAMHPALGMAVIVGKAQGNHDTPVFFATMREVVLRPYWDVPLRIAARELVPAIRRNAGYLDREALEIVRGEGTNKYEPTSDNLSRVSAGTLRLRQRPGPNNALGLVKFVFPNRYNVYMHGTPAPQLFSHSRRDFSHGCIRVEDPPALLDWVLGEQDGWTHDSLATAMQGDRTQRVPLARPVEVWVLYGTAVTRPNGDTYFYADLYGHDRTLERLLAAYPSQEAPGTLMSPQHDLHL